ncbi:hypothetical protein ACXR2U_22665 [Jatrophihabitans sp. YIM 134969]
MNTRAAATRRASGATLLTVLLVLVSAWVAAAPPAAAAPVPDGITPRQLQTIYGVRGASPPAGTTVGIVVAYDAPDLESDLAEFRSTWGLPACTTANGCLRKVDQRGLTVPPGKSRTSPVPPVYENETWEKEATLDAEAVSALCPGCSILVVEADSTSLTQALGPAVVRAQTLGATVISNSFAGGESEDMVDAQRDYWSEVTVPVFAGSGDHAWQNLDRDPGDPYYNQAYFPASSPSVVAVGGTSASVAVDGTVLSETAWSDAGSGCSFAFPRPAAQAAYFSDAGIVPYSRCSVAGGGPARASADMSAIADVAGSGFPLYRGGWSVEGGTSLSVQLVAALAAYAGPRPSGSSITDVAYTLARFGAPDGLVDLTTGSNRTAALGCASKPICTARAGWDGPTGLGTPRGPGLFAPLLAADPATVPGGAPLHLTGSNLVPGETVQFTVAGQVVGTATVDAYGTYADDLVLPVDVTGTVSLTVTGTTSALTATVPVTVAPLAVTPATQTVTVGATATLQLSGFGVDEPVTATADSGGDGTVVASGTASDFGSGTLTWTTGVVGTKRVVVTGATTGRSVTVYVNVVSGAARPDAPTVLSAVPTTAGGAVVGVRVAATGVRARSVAVVGSDGTLSPRATVSATGDAFVTVPSLADGTTVTYTAVAGTAAGDSDPSAASLPITGNASPGGGDLTPVGPVRLVDSRQVGGPLGRGATRTVPVAGRAGVPASGVSAVVVSLTLLAPSARTYLTLWPAGENRPVVSNANALAGSGNKATLAKVKLGAGGALSIYNFAGTAGFILDVVGFYAAPGDPPVFAHNQSYGATTPVRVADTRGNADAPTRSGGSIVVPVRDGVSGVRTGVPADATGVELLVQSVNATTSGYVTVYPTGLAGGVPRVSNVQAGPGRPVATAVVATIGADGTVTAFAQARTDVIVDVVGYYAPSASGRFTPVSPYRYYDSRAGSATPFGPRVTRSIPVVGARVPASSAVPVGATAVSFSLTAVDNSAPSYLTAWRTGTARPLVTSLLPQPAHGLFDNLALSALSAGGAFSIYNNGGQLDVLVDVQGYYAAAPS